MRSRDAAHPLSVRGGQFEPARITPGHWYRVSLDAEGPVLAGTLSLPDEGAAVIFRLASARPLRLWLDGLLVLDADLSWRNFQRTIEAHVVVPRLSGRGIDVRIEVGERPSHPPSLDVEAPSLHRRETLQALSEAILDAFEFHLTLAPEPLPAMTLRYHPTQFRSDGWMWQVVEFLGLPDTTHRPSTQSDQRPWAWPAALSPGAPVSRPITLNPSPEPSQIAIPVWPLEAWPSPLRSAVQETRPEPALETTGELPVTVAWKGAETALSIPVYEGLGRNFAGVISPLSEAPSPRRHPRVTLDDHRRPLLALYEGAWDMIERLIRPGDYRSGLPGPYVATGSNFPHHQFVWDTAFTAMAIRFGWPEFPVESSLDLIYSRQFDGGYIHREHDVHTGLPVSYEPDFSPNPPLLAEAEWRLVSVTGHLNRLRQVYPVLRDYHAWLIHNRRRANGTYWTTGLASGLDNTFSYGEGYVCLTAQMIQDAEVLARICAVLGYQDEESGWLQEVAATKDALNHYLWDPDQQIYTSSTAGGGHNPNKVVTAFWPLWANAVPEDRLPALLSHLQDPGFNRHHPVPSLAADSPHFEPAGGYWRGSVWSPTNFAVIQGLLRTGQRSMASAFTVKHLEAVARVYQHTGRLWENYSSEADEPGNQSAPDYAWSALGPIALFIEVLLGIVPDAIHQTVWWDPTIREMMAIEALTIGSTTLNIRQWPVGDRWEILVESDGPITLKRRHRDQWVSWNIRPGTQRFHLDA